MATKKHLIIGAGPAALSALEELRRLNSNDEVKLVTREDCLPYSPAALSYLLSGAIKESQLWMRDESYFKSMKSTLTRGKEVTQVDPEVKKVTYKDGSSESYDNLLIASGAEPVKLAIKGLTAAGTQDFRTLADCRNLIKKLDGVKSAAIVGSGLVGMKIAVALLEKGLRVNIIEKEKGILPLNFDDEAEVYIRDIFTGKGACFYTGKDIVSVTRNDGEIGISFSEGGSVDAGILVNAAGVKGRVSFIRNGGAAGGSGIAVDSRMKTGLDHIYAAGDAAQTHDFFSGKPKMSATIWGAVRQGRVAGANMAGDAAEYEGAIPLAGISFFGNTAFSIGLTSPNKRSAQVFKQKNDDSRSFKKLILDGDRLIGAMLVNEKIDPGIVLHLIRGRVDISPFKEALFEGTKSLSDPWLNCLKFRSNQ